MASVSTATAFSGREAEMGTWTFPDVGKAIGEKPLGESEAQDSFDEAV